MSGADLTPAQGRALLLVSLEPQSLTELGDRSAVRGALIPPARLRASLDQLAALGLVESAKTPGRVGWRYRLASGADVDEALDLAFNLARGWSL